MKKNDPPIVVEQEFSISSKQLWTYLTEPKFMKQWFFEQMKDFKAEKGFTTDFVVSHEDRVFPHIWKVVDVKDRELLSVEWTYEGYIGRSEVRFIVEGNEKASKIRVETLIHEDFPQDVPEFKRESCQAGWKYFIQERLTNFVNTRS